MCKNASLIFPAMQAAKNADATVIVAGIDLSIEAESRDRLDLRVPGFQAQLITQVAQVAKGPVILVIMSGGGVDISFARDSDNVKGIVWAGYPGEEGGQAIADVIFGKYNPGKHSSFCFVLYIKHVLNVEFFTKQVEDYHSHGMKEVMLICCQ